MKDNKNYLHLYMKCRGTFTRKSYKYVYTHYCSGEWALSGSLYHEIMVMGHEFKPHLSRLSDMSEEEAIELDWTFPFQTSPAILINNLVPKEFVYLLSKGFDLFNLIESGLAIDKKTVNENEHK